MFSLAGRCPRAAASRTHGPPATVSLLPRACKDPNCKARKALCDDVVKDCTTFGIRLHVCERYACVRASDPTVRNVGSADGKIQETRAGDSWLLVPQSLRPLTCKTPASDINRQKRRLPGTARQAGGHWFEPSTAHEERPRKRGFFFSGAVSEIAREGAVSANVSDSMRSADSDGGAPPRLKGGWQYDQLVVASSRLQRT